MFEGTAKFVDANRSLITVEAKDGNFYWIRLKETEGNYNTIGEGIWKYKKTDEVEVELTDNKKFALTRNRTTGKTHSVSILKILPAGEMHVKSIIQGRKHRASVEKFHKFLETLGLEFELDYPYYMDDYASLIVWHNGEIVFHGQSIDLNNRSEER